MTAHHTMAVSAHSSMQTVVHALGSVVTALENRVLALAFATMVALPIAEIVLRATLQIGIENVGSLVQHLALFIGTLGAAVAAREGRLLAFAGARYIGGRAGTVARVVSHSVSVAICAVLCYGALTFVEFERLGGTVLAYGIPLWVVELVIPAGFALIAVRFLQETAGSASTLATTLLFATLAIATAMWLPVPIEVLRIVAIIVILIAAGCGAPVFVAVGGTALILLWTSGVPLASLAIDQYSLIANPTLPAIPLFTLAGFFLAESRATERFVAMFDACFGRFRGGAGLATVVVCTFFTSFTGASGVTILALGGLLLPLLTNSGYGRKTALGLITAGGTPGVMLMPALPLILYAIIAQVSIEEMFLGGLLPAMLMLGIAAAWGLTQVNKTPNVSVEPFDAGRALRSIWIAKWELLLPVVLFAGLFSGRMTPIEAAATTAFYAFIVEAVIHRDLSIGKDVPRVLVQCGLLVGGILLILGVALGLANYMVDARISERAVDWVTQSIREPWVFLLTLNAFLLIVGFFVDVFSAIVVIAPMVVPIGAAFGIDPVHLGIVFLANLELGYLTPPVGMNLFFASSRFERPIPEICRSVWPLFGLFAIGVLVVTYVPWLSTALPDLVR